MSLATAGMALVLALLLPFLPTGNSWLGGIIGMVAGALVYLGLAYALRVQELKAIQAKLSQRLLRK